MQNIIVTETIKIGLLTFGTVWGLLKWLKIYKKINKKRLLLQQI
jgi:hypothetical protein